MYTLLMSVVPGSLYLLTTENYMRMKFSKSLDGTSAIDYFLNTFMRSARQAKQGASTMLVRLGELPKGTTAAALMMRLCITFRQRRSGFGHSDRPIESDVR